MDIVFCDDTLRERWDAFVTVQNKSRHYHLFGWRQVVEGTYGHPCLYLLAREGDAVRGVLPLAVVQSRLFGRSVTSLPFLDEAGLLTSDGEAEAALLEHALKLARDCRVDYLELRQSRPLGEGFRVDTRKASLTLNLRPTVEETWDALPSERRNRVRKARKAGLSAEHGGRALLARFYPVWSRNMRDLGSPAHSRRFFEGVLEAFSDSARVLVVRAGEADVGAALTLEYRGTCSVPWVSSLRSHFHLHPNDLLYWEAMKLALQGRCGRFDFGRSTELSGNYVYKTRWGAEPSPLFWHYRSISGRRDAPVESEGTGFGLAAEVWKRMPVKLTNWLGPAIRKSITR